MATGLRCRPQHREPKGPIEAGQAGSVIDTPAGYPHHLVARRHLPDGTSLLLRPIAPADRQRHWRFICGLSLQTRYQRLMSPRCLLPGELRRMVEIDYRREMALVALAPSQDGPGGAMARETAAEPTWGTTAAGADAAEVGVARYVRVGDDAVEFALVVADAWQRRGLGRLLLEHLVSAATAAGTRHLGGITLATNTPVIRLARRLGFEVSGEPGDWTVKRLALRRPAPDAALRIPP